MFAKLYFPISIFEKKLIITASKTTNETSSSFEKEVVN